MKEALLKLFNNLEEEAFLSGEKISRQLDCTRTAVWKTIEQLREEGYRFEAVPHKGYRLLDAPDKLSAHVVKAKLETRWAGSQVIFEPVVPSTQSVAQELARQGAREGTLVLTEQQEQGRGRLNKPWHSPDGTGIWMSLITRPTVPLKDISQLTLVAAVAVVQTLRRLSLSYGGPQLHPEEIQIKWPNDIYIRRRKVCGILTELSAETDRIHTCVIGIGMNVNQESTDFPQDLQEKATSLRIESGGRDWNRIEIICLVLRHFEDLYETYQKQGFHAIKPLWEADALAIGTPVSVHVREKLVRGTFQGINEDGAMLLTDHEGKEETLYAGEIDLQ